MSSYYQSYPSAPDPNLQFYSSAPQASAGQTSSFYQGRPSLDPGARPAVAGTIGGRPGAGAAGGASTGGPSGSTVGLTGPIVVANWWNAFTPWTGMEGEVPLLEELGVNFEHIVQKSLTVLNPLKPVEPSIMDDADLAGPLVFCFVFAMVLLLSGKPQFSYIYGVALLGSAFTYALLNLMSQQGIDAYRTASVLGYCLLPLVLLSIINVVLALDGGVGYVLTVVTIAWCAYSASSIFTSVLRMQSQRLLVAYPVAMVYACFRLSLG